MTDAGLVDEWRRTFAEPTSGWDFTSFAGRVRTEEPPWSFTAIVRGVLDGAVSALDLGTGGGERLLALADALPADTHATEGWEPNVYVARAALGTLGVPVVVHGTLHGDLLPYPAARFDVVMSRHAAYVAADVARVLRPRGTFVTQQVDGRNLDDLAAVFGAGPAFPDVTLPELRREAEAAGLRVERAEEWAGRIAFADVTTMLSYLRMVPWQLPADFTVEHHAGELLALHRRSDPLEFTERRFLLVARPGLERSACRERS